MTQPVILLGCAGRVTLAIARSLHHHGIPVSVAALSQKEPFLRSNAIKHFVRLPSFRDAPEEFNQALSALICDGRSDMLVPCSDSALIAIEQHYDHFNKLLHVACPPPHIVRRVLNKGVTLEFANRCGIPVPITYPIDDIGDLEAIKGKVTFPVIAKPREKTIKGGEGFRIRYFYSFEQLHAAFSHHHGFGRGVLLQEYCTGGGVGIEILLHQRKPIAMLQHRRIKELPVMGGVSTCAVTESLDPKLAKSALILLEALEWDGVAMVEFRRNDATRTAVLMEVNGRYWGTLPLAIHAGMDFPFYEWQLAHGSTPNLFQTHYRIGVRRRWTAGELLRVYSVLTELRSEALSGPSRFNQVLGFIADLVPPTKSMIWSIGDPLPAVHEVLRTGVQIFKMGAKKIIKQMLPEQLATHLLRYMDLSRKESVIYAKRQFLRTVRLKRRPLLHLGKVRSVLFVCHGNIIRSPIAAALMKKYFGDDEDQIVSIKSAGLHANPFRGADPRAITISGDFDIALEKHKAQPITRNLVDDADVIFVMDYLNEAMLLARYPDVEHKVFMLGAFKDSVLRREAEIKDPYEDDIEAIRECYQFVASCIDNMVSQAFSLKPDETRRRS